MVPCESGIAACTAVTIPNVAPATANARTSRGTRFKRFNLPICPPENRGALKKQREYQPLQTEGEFLHASRKASSDQKGESGGGTTGGRRRCWRSSAHVTYERRRFPIRRRQASVGWTRASRSAKRQA